MSIRNRERQRQAEPYFPEAIAQWRLAMRTQVKSASALPTSVFHARDAMLETLLAETNEGMLARLQPPGPQGTPAPASAEKRLEIVTADELQALPPRFDDAGDPPIDLDDHLATETEAVLADACCSGHEAAATGAASMLLRECTVDPAASPEIAAAMLLQRLPEAVHRLPGVGDALADLCQRLVATIALHAEGKPDARDLP